jgi:NitT/TauT family transport system ATP-binding protein
MSGQVIYQTRDEVVYRQSADAGPAVGDRPRRIEFDAVTHWFGNGRGKLTLRDVAFHIGDGQFVGVVGPSGCGKTTLLNMVAGFLQPAEGTVLLDGEPIRRPHPNKISYMFARDQLLPWRRAIRNIELGMEFGGRKRSRPRAQELLNRVGLAGFEDYYPAELSQGMRQRVALARTLAAGGDIWLMDEPFAALDAHTRTVLQGQLLALWEAERKSVLFVTHDVTEAIALSDVVVVMSPHPGTVRSVYDVPLPRPRDVIEMHRNEVFVDLFERIWSDLRGELDGEEVAAQ